CKQLKRAMRVGTNHGSLSDRIMNRYGDTPLGMVESALEFLRIARRHDYHDIVLSMKSSNPKVMIQAYRLLVLRMDQEQMDYPLHLGVTEAGDGEDGRVKSAVGICSLLEDGLGDTVRVSLTEDPEFEMPVAFRIARRYGKSGLKKTGLFNAADEAGLGTSWIAAHPITEYRRRAGGECKLAATNLHDKSLVRVFSPAPHKAAAWRENWRFLTDYRYGSGESLIRPEIMVLDIADDADLAGLREFLAQARPAKVPVVARFQADKALESAAGCGADMLAINFGEQKISPEYAARFTPLFQAAAKEGQALLLEFAVQAAEPIFSGLAHILDRCEALGCENVLIAVTGSEAEPLIHLNRALCAWMDLRPLRHPLLLSLDSAEEPEERRISASTALGSLLCDGVGDAVMIRSVGPTDTVALSFNVLQAAQVRISKTEFISCPSCGRTLFDLQEVTARIKKRTGHLV
ncbi:MAG: flavodoxin-dependent (E)-4-hydroxy-3-methylbut-2-enyl-diphosphate synthase, partial [candidate division FCPU426 bacterium]